MRGKRSSGKYSASRLVAAQTRVPMRMGKTTESECWKGEGSSGRTGLSVIDVEVEERL